MQTKGRSLLSELFFNLFLPTLLLLKGYQWLGLSPKLGVVIAMACPLSYGLIDWIKEGHFSWIALLGLVSVTIKGSIGVFECSNEWLAINEALLPSLFGSAIVAVRLLKKPPFLKKFLLNDQFCYIEAIERALEAREAKVKFEQSVCFYEWILAVLFYMSAVLNFVLAKYLVVHPSGSNDFNRELGLLTGWSFVVIAVPATLGLIAIVWRFFVRIQVLSGLEWKEILRE